MKNLIKFSAILLTASAFFSSCSSNLAITKRHYTSGFYVDYSKGNKTIAPNKATLPTAAAPIIAVPVVTNNPVANSKELVKNTSPLAIVNIKKMLPKIHVLPVAKQANATSSGSTITPASESSPIVSESPKMNTGISDDGGEHAALSLLWLVIVIILILWLVGLLAGGFGLGGLINLLLVVALILLVLWLLRII